MKSSNPDYFFHVSNAFLFLLALRRAFASSPEIQQMAQEDFIMLNLVVSLNFKILKCLLGSGISRIKSRNGFTLHSFEVVFEILFFLPLLWGRTTGFAKHQHSSSLEREQGDTSIHTFTYLLAQEYHLVFSNHR